MDNNLRIEFEVLQQEFTKFKNDYKKLEEELRDLKKTYEKHVHKGDDGSLRLKDTIELQEGTYIKTGCMIVEGISDAFANQGVLVGAISIGNDLNPANGSDNAQLIVEHDQSSLNTFFYGNRSPLYTGVDAFITSGATTMQQNTFNWTTNELAGAFVIVNTSSTEFDFYEIASNTSTTLTITGGTWSATETGAEWIVFMPVYFGSAQYPWRRLYTMDGSTGGIRFGGGDTNGGQNALLYTDGANLKFRKKDGTVTTVTVT